MYKSFWIDFSDLYEMRCLQVVEASPALLPLAFYSRDSPISTDDFTHVSCIFRLHLFSHIFPKKSYFMYYFA